MIKAVMEQMSQVTHDAIMILDSKPVDTLTNLRNQVAYQTHKKIGTGTALETSRYKTLILKYYQIDPKNIEAFVIGEYSVHALPVWSKVRVHGMELHEFEKLAVIPPIDKEKIIEIIDKVSMD